MCGTERFQPAHRTTHMHDLEEVKLMSVQEFLEPVDMHFPLLSEEARKAVKNLKFDF